MHIDAGKIIRIVAEYFTQIRKNNKYIPTEKEIQHVDEVLKLLAAFGEEEGIEKFLNEQRKGRHRVRKDIFLP